MEQLDDLSKPPCVGKHLRRVAMATSSGGLLVSLGGTRHVQSASQASGRSGSSHVMAEPKPRTARPAAPDDFTCIDKMLHAHHTGRFATTEPPLVMGPAPLSAGQRPPAATPLRRSARFEYFAAFDFLGQAQPVLAGFVRQQAGKTASFAALAERWRWRLNDMRLLRDHAISASPCICEMLDSAGFDGADLSLFYRRASDAEIAAFDMLSLSDGRVLKCVVPDGEGQWRAVRQTGQSIPGAPVTLPDVLAHASPGSIPPKLITSLRSTRSGLPLAHAIEQLPPAQGELARKHLIDVTGLDPLALARMAASGAGSAILRAAGLDGWTFAIRPQGWAASHDNGARRIVVREDAFRLLVELQVHDSRRQIDAIMLPVHPHDQVSTLLRLLRPLQDVLP